MNKKIQFAFVYSILNSVSFFVGWGFNDFLGFFADFLRILVLIIHFITFFWMGLYLTFGNMEKKAGSKVKKQDIITFFSFIGPILFQILGPFFERYGSSQVNLLLFNNEAIKWIGFGILLSGLFFMIWAPIYLGDFFSLNIEIQKNHKLVDGGPFRLVRHPKYFGTALYYLGMSLLYQSYILLILDVIILMLIIWRIKDEENLLSQEFNEKWEEHCTKIRWRLIPFIW